MATSQTKTETTVTTVGVTLELSMDEVAALLAVLALVGGDPDTSPRGHADSVYRALRDAVGYPLPQTGAEVNRVTRGVYFDNYPPARPAPDPALLKARVIAAVNRNYYWDGVPTPGGNKINAIKALRDAMSTPLGLKEAKDLVEAEIARREKAAAA